MIFLSAIFRWLIPKPTEVSSMDVDEDDDDEPKFSYNISERILFFIKWHWLAWRASRTRSPEIEYEPFEDDWDWMDDVYEYDDEPPNPPTNWKEEGF